MITWRYTIKDRGVSALISPVGLIPLSIVLFFSLRYKLVGENSNRRPRAATKPLRKRHEGPWVWLAYREGRCLFSTHIAPPCFLTFVRRVHFQTFEGGIGAPRFLASERPRVVGNRIDRAMSERDAGA